MKSGWKPQSVQAGIWTQDPLIRDDLWTCIWNQINKEEPIGGHVKNDIFAHINELIYDCLRGSVEQSILGVVNEKLS